MIQDELAKSENKEGYYWLWKWSDGGFSDIEKAGSQPWESWEGNNDTKSAYSLLAASVHVSSMVQKGIVPGTIGKKIVFSWEKGFPTKGPGEIEMENMLASYSSGPVTTYGYSAPSSTHWQTCRVILNPTGGAMIQPVGGKKYAWQREVLYPQGTATLIIHRQQVDFSTMLVSQVEIPFPKTNDFTEDVLTQIFSDKEKDLADELLVDKSIREDYKTLKGSALREKLKKERDVENLGEHPPDRWQEVFGQTTLENWQNALTLAKTSKTLMTLDGMRGHHAAVLGEKQELREGLLRWGNPLKNLTREQRNTLAQYHNVSSPRTLWIKNVNESIIKQLIETLEKNKNWFGNKTILQNIPLDKEDKAKYKATINGLIEALKTGKDSMDEEDKIIDISDEAWETLSQEGWLRELKMDEYYSVYYQEVKSKEFKQEIKQKLKELETRAVRIKWAETTGVIPPEARRAVLQLISTELYHKVIAWHPFNDGNGRLARIMMIKFLKAHLGENFDPKQDIPKDFNPDNDLYYTTDEWGRLLYPEAAEALDYKNLIKHLEENASVITDKQDLDDFDDGDLDNEGFSRKDGNSRSKKDNSEPKKGKRKRNDGNQDIPGSESTMNS